MLVVYIVLWRVYQFHVSESILTCYVACHEDVMHVSANKQAASSAVRLVIHKTQVSANLIHMYIRNSISEGAI